MRPDVALHTWNIIYDIVVFFFLLIGPTERSFPHNVIKYTRPWWIYHDKNFAEIIHINKYYVVSTARLPTAFSLLNFVLNKVSIGSCNWLGAVRQQTSIWTIVVVISS